MSRYSPPRSVHLVGSYPAATVSEALAVPMEQVDSRLRSLADGEVAERSSWIAHIVERLREHPDVTLVTDGDWSSYTDRPVFRVRRGHEFRPESLRLGYAAQARESYETFRELRSDRGLHDLDFQVGIPSDLDLAFFLFEPVNAFRHRPVVRAALAEELREIHSWNRDDVIFQIECPMELVLAAGTPSPLRPALAALLVNGILGQVAAAPQGSRFGIHLCFGDLNREGLWRARDTRPAVALLRRLLRAWPQGRTLEYVHAPLGSGDFPALPEARAYLPLRELRELPRDVRFVAGFAHERQTLESQQVTLRLVEAALGRRVDVAASCGLGRCTPEQAAANLRRARELADLPPQPGGGT
ncbi:hypothetical protein FHX37_3218 [Haloactinospora alba]|uniref:Methionine synthase II (Cobalamin-independent) n=1 Tax=Haloactinospora alba TaxID=405555 RepID=A0A543NN19_9ACTN|nr:hypothetical protein [Haloactinospora alba]TQN33213.1 hypothetical protein FHX37_3218 [Haloactinospora alba]